MSENCVPVVGYTHLLCEFVLGFDLFNVLFLVFGPVDENLLVSSMSHNLFSSIHCQSFAVLFLAEPG